MSRRLTAFVVGPFGAGTRSQAGALPYGADRLEDFGYVVTYSDPDASWLYRMRLGKAMDAAHRVTRTPVFAAITEPVRVLRSDLVVCIFEDNLAALAPLVRLRRWTSAGPRRSALIVCWLAEDVDAMSQRQKRKWRRRLMSFDDVLVFSSNQVSLLTSHLQLPADLVRAIPFGVSVPLDMQPVIGGRVSDLEILAVGTDRSRDFETFVAAVKNLPYRSSIITNNEWADRLGDVHPVAVEGPLPYEEYLARLTRSAILVLPTLPVAYPTGQTVLLEALRLGKPCVVTRSEALADYVTADRDVLTVSPRDVAELTSAITRLATDESLRLRIAEQAACTGSRFSQERMWKALLGGTS